MDLLQPQAVPQCAMRLQFGALGVTMSWDDGFLGARASRPHQAWHSLGISPTWINGNSAMALLRPGRCCSRPQGGCLQHRTEAQRRPKEQVCGRDARAPRAITPPLRGSRRSRAARRRLMRWGVSGGRLLRKPTCTLWESPDCPRGRAPATLCGSFEEKRPIVHE